MSVTFILLRTARRLLDALLIVVVAVVFGTIVLSRLVPMVTGGQTFVVRGGSMEPAIRLGSAVVVAPVAASQLNVGDIVTVEVGPDKAVFTHRITRLVPRDDGLWLQTKGDANPTEDPSIIPATAVIGRAVVAIPGIGYLIALLSTLPGIALVISVSTSILAAGWFLEMLEAGRRSRGTFLTPDDVRVAEPRLGTRPTG